MTSRNLIHRKGFTLVELVVVITIIGIIAAAGTLSYSSSLSQARDEKVKANVENIRISLELFKRNGSTKFYPDSLEILNSQGFEVPPHPVSNGLAEYVYTPLPTGCTSTTSCSTYEMRVPLEEGTNVYLATPLSSQVISSDGITPTATPAATRTPTPTLVPPTRTPTPTTGAWSTPIPTVSTSTPTPRPTLFEFNCAACASWSQFSLACGAAVGCPAGQSSFVCVGHINCVECRIPSVACATSVTVAPTIRVGPTSGFGDETM